jgi:hypothetical protein
MQTGVMDSNDELLRKLIGGQQSTGFNLPGLKSLQPILPVPQWFSTTSYLSKYVGTVWTRVKGKHRHRQVEIEEITPQNVKVKLLNTAYDKQHGRGHEERQVARMDLMMFTNLYQPNEPGYTIAKDAITMLRHGNLAGLFAQVVLSGNVGLERKNQASQPGLAAASLETDTGVTKVTEGNQTEVKAVRQKAGVIEDPVTGAQMLRCPSAFHEGERLIPVEQFARNRSRYTGYQTECKDCRRKIDMDAARKKVYQIAPSALSAPFDPKNSVAAQPTNPTEETSVVAVTPTPDTTNGVVVETPEPTPPPSADEEKAIRERVNAVLGRTPAQAATVEAPVVAEPVIEVQVPGPVDVEAPSKPQETVDAVPDVSQVPSPQDHKSGIKWRVTVIREVTEEVYAATYLDAAAQFDSQGEIVAIQKVR